MGGIQFWYLRCLFSVACEKESERKAWMDSIAEVVQKQRKQLHEVCALGMCVLLPAYNVSAEEVCKYACPSAHITARCGNGP